MSIFFNGLGFTVRRKLENESTIFDLEVSPEIGDVELGIWTGNLEINIVNSIKDMLNNTTVEDIAVAIITRDEVLQLREVIDNFLLVTLDTTTDQQ